MKKNTSNIHEITIKIEGKEWEEAQDKAFEKRNKSAKIDGFRPGKAPKNVFIKHYGKESLYFDAADSLFQVAYTKVMEENKLIPVCEPKVDIKEIDETGVTFLFTIITKPELTIKSYKGLDVKKEKVTVKKEEVDHELGHLLERFTELVVKDGKVANGDVTVIDFEGFKDGVAFEGGKAENYTLEIGSGSFIPGFEEQLVGMKAGEEKDITVTFPEEYGEASLAGKEAVFKIKLHEVKSKKLPEMDKDFFEDLAMEGVDTEEKLRDTLKEQIKARKENDAENKYIDDLLDAVAKQTTVDIPEEMVDDEIHRLIHRFEEQLKMQGLSLDMYYQFTKTSHEDLHTQFKEEAYKNVLYRLILDEVKEKEKIEVTLEEGEAEADKLALRYNMPKEELLKEFGGLEMVMYDLEVRKTFDVLKELNK